MISRNSNYWFSKLLSVFVFIISLTAFGGGFGLIFFNGLSMPTEWLKDSFFTSYLWPGLILFFIVGGTHLLAAFTTFRRKSFAPEFLAIAGFGMLIWIFIEVFVTHQSEWLQITYFMFGILTLISAWFLKLKTPKPLLIN